MKKGILIFLCIFIVIGIVTTVILNSSNENLHTEYITLEEFNKIQTGMTYDEVVNIIGSNGTLSSESEVTGYHTQIFTWQGYGVPGANANVTFQNNKVVTKAQAGLK